MAEVAQLKAEASITPVDYGTAGDDGHGHQFKLRSFKTVTFCSVCDGMLWGFMHQGYNCGLCDMSVHRGCEPRVTDGCKMAHAEEEAQTPLDSSAHKFGVYNFKTPSFCSHCGSMLFGFCNQGLKCADCDRKVHHRCGVKIARSCDVTQH